MFRLHGIPQDIVSDQGLRWGRHSVKRWRPWLICILVTTPRPMARWSGLIRMWNPPYALSIPASRPPGPLICCGSNMPTTCWSALVLTCRPSWWCVVISLLCSPVRSQTLQFPWCRRTFTVPVESGGRLVQPWLEHLHAFIDWLTDIAPQPHNAKWANKSGSLLECIQCLISPCRVLFCKYTTCK